jgi:hypothetical protein
LEQVPDKLELDKLELASNMLELLVLDTTAWSKLGSNSRSEQSGQNNELDKRKFYQTGERES